MRTLTHLALLTSLTILAALLFACESTGGGSYGGDAGAAAPAADTGSSAVDAVATEDIGTPLPQDTGTSTPEDASTPTPEDASTPTPEDASTPTPEDASTPTPEDTSTSTPDVPCAADCAGKQCGDDGCGGSCGDCQGNEVCEAGQCTCVPNCVGKQCGSDDCGGSCGNCSNGEECNQDSGQCESTDPEPEPTVCDQYCNAVAMNCTGENAISWDTNCATDCAGWPEGEAGDTAVNTTHCRLYHAGAAAGDGAALHCPHASPDGGGVCVDIPEPSDAACCTANGPCPTDTACHANVCAIDSWCCTGWDNFCASCAGGEGSDACAQACNCSIPTP